MMKKRKCLMDGEITGRQAIVDEGDEVEEAEKEAAAAEEEDDDEKKINIFYSLIRNIKEARNQMMTNGSSNSKQNGRNNENEKHGSRNSSWTPSFTWEDFAGEFANLRDNISHDHIAMVPASSSTNLEQPQTPTREDLDLNLSL